MNDTTIIKNKKASPLERIVGLLPLSMHTFALIVSNASESCSIRESPRRYYGGLVEENISEVRKYAKLFFYGEIPEEFLRQTQK